METTEVQNIKNKISNLITYINTNNVLANTPVFGSSNDKIYVSKVIVEKICNNNILKINIVIKNDTINYYCFSTFYYSLKDNIFILNINDTFFKDYYLFHSILDECIKLSTAIESNRSIEILEDNIKHNSYIEFVNLITEKVLTRSEIKNIADRFNLKVIMPNYESSVYIEIYKDSFDDIDEKTFIRFCRSLRYIIDTSELRYWKLICNINFDNDFINDLVKQACNNNVRIGIIRSTKGTGNGIELLYDSEYD